METNWYVFSGGTSFERLFPTNAINLTETEAKVIAELRTAAERAAGRDTLWVPALMN